MGPTVKHWLWTDSSNDKLLMPISFVFRIFSRRLLREGCRKNLLFPNLFLLNMVVGDLISGLTFCTPKHYLPDHGDLWSIWVAKKLQSMLIFKVLITDFFVHQLSIRYVQELWFQYTFAEYQTGFATIVFVKKKFNARSLLYQSCYLV